MEDDPGFSPLADAFVGHYETLRGVVRLELVCRQLVEHLPAPPAALADVGGGGGRVAARLAELGYRVTVADPSASMLEKAAAHLAAQGDDVSRRVTLVRVTGEEAPAVLGESRFDGVLCHGVLAYLDAPDAMVGALVRLARPGGVVSIVAKQAGALALRPGLQGRWAEALAALDADRDRGNLGVVTRGDTLERLEELLAAAGAPVVAWYGVRLLTDHLGAAPPPRELDELLEAEWEVSRRDPYRGVSRMLHVVARRAG